MRVLFLLMGLRIRHILAWVGVLTALLVAGHDSAMALNGARMHDGMGAPLNIGLVCVLLVAVVGAVGLTRPRPDVPTLLRDARQPEPTGRAVGLHHAAPARASPAWLQCFRR